MYLVLANYFGFNILGINDNETICHLIFRYYFSYPLNFTQGCDGSMDEWQGAIYFEVNGQFIMSDEIEMYCVGVT